MANIRRSNEVRFFEKVSNFPRNLYKIDDRNSYLFKFLYSILETGVGQLKSIQDVANQSQESLANTVGTDLDEFYQIFGIKRDAQQVYNGNLFTDLSVDDIQNYQAADSKFRTKIAKVLQAVQKGGTTEGIRLMAEAVSSLPVQVIEPWQDDENSSIYARVDSINEVVVLILANKILTEDERRDLKTKVAGSLEMIRPSGTLITIDVVNPITSEQEEILQSDYAVSGSFMFMSDGNNQYVELLSQEREIEINSFVVDATSFVVDSRFSTAIGNLAVDGDLDSGLVVQETMNLSLPVFLALLSDKVDSEIVFVYNKFNFENNSETFALYEVERAQLGTQKINWNDKTDVMLRINLIEFASGTVEDENSNISDILPIPKADSPDNFPNGQYENDPTKYDANGNYVYEWSSQQEYEEWFKSQIDKSGGQTDEVVYRMPRVVTLSMKKTLIAALGKSFNILRPIITPKKYRDAE